MGFIDAFKRLISPYDDGDDFVDEAAAMESGVRVQEKPSAAAAVNVSGSQTEYGAAQPRHAPFQQGGGGYPQGQAQRQQGQYQQPYQQQYQQPPSAQQAQKAQRPKEGRVVNMGTNSKTQMVLMQPKNFSSSSEAMEHLRNRRAVVINMDKTDKDAVAPLLYFLSGFTYAINGNVRQVSANTYIMTPPSVNLVGDQQDQLETSGAGL